MTVVTEQTSAELRAHMKRLQAIPGWHNPLDDRLFKEIQALDAEIATLRSTLPPIAITAEEAGREGEAKDVPSEKQRKLMELADRIDYERLCLRPGMTHRDMTPEQRDRMNAGVELRRYAQIWKADRWIVIPPAGPVRFSASTLDMAYEMAKKDEARKLPPTPAQSGGQG